MYGGDGDDLLSYVSSNTAVIVSLASGTGSGGEAEGDVFAAFEDVLGSPYDDILIGDGGANALYGQFGNDILWGEGGDDKLYGISAATASWVAAEPIVSMAVSATTRRPTTIRRRASSSLS